MLATPSVSPVPSPSPPDEPAELVTERQHALSVRARADSDHFGSCWFYFSGFPPERQRHLEAIVRCGGGFSVKAVGVVGVSHVVIGPDSSKRDADVVALREQRPAPVFVNPLWLLEASTTQRLLASSPFVFAEDVVA